MRAFHEIFLIRHGETISNAEGRFQGSHDSPLSERGRADVIRLGRFFRERLPAVDFWFVSPQGRARDTSRTIRAELNTAELPDEEVHDELREIHCGHFETRLHAEVDQDILARIRTEPDYRYPGGESRVDVAVRALTFLERFRARVRSESRPEPVRAVIIAHGNLNQCLGGVLIGVDPLLSARSIIVNTGICRFFARDLDGPFLLRAWGETPHLDEWP
jgi:broad specificity phosphatase PhoE